LALPEEPWSNAGGTYYPEEHLDRIDRWRVTLRNDGAEPTVARLMFIQQKHLPITGFTPMLCEPDGTPTGIPVQVSKNWHSRPEKGRLPHDGTWFHGFAWVRVPPQSRRELVLQMVHARYGGVFAASHAQLSLIGWGHNQFWDQVAVGSFGESICFEPGRVQRRCFITDVRPLMTLSREPAAKRWGWAENCGGGDFLMWKDTQGRYQPMKATRTDYRSHGPCLTDVCYSEESSGVITKNYPLVIGVDGQQRAEVIVRGGLGHLPVTFTGLKSAGGHRMLVNGEAITHWQTDWNAATQRWQMVCNVAVGREREVEIVLDRAE
jgi:hypothetical protein